MVDVGYIGGNDGIYQNWNTNGFSISTSHGVQISPYIFVGAGLAYQRYKVNEDYWADDSWSAVPFFANFRVNMTKTTVSPYFDAKIGYSTADCEGLYASPSFGVRIGLQGNLGLNLSAGYTVQGYKYQDTFTSHASGYLHSLTLNLGLDF